MAILNIHTYPDPALKRKAVMVTVFDRDLAKIADSMLETMYEEHGIGLASIQVGVLKQLVVIDLKSLLCDLRICTFKFFRGFIRISRIK